MNLVKTNRYYYFSSRKPKWNSFLDIIWADGTKDIFTWIKPNVEQLDFEIDCKPIKWRYSLKTKDRLENLL